METSLKGDRPWRIDVHHHFGCPAYDRFAETYPDAGLPPSPAGGIARSIADMDEGGVVLSILSSFAPTTGGSLSERRELARAINAHGADLVRENPGRFALFAVLPLPDVEGCLAELAYGFDVLGAVGASIYTEADGKYLGDPSFAPLLTELDQRSAVLFVHPKTDTCCQNLVPGVPDTVIEFGTSTTRTIASLLFDGAVDRYPNIRFIFSHGGGTMPFLIQRFLGGSSAEIVPGIVSTGAPFPPMGQPNGGALTALRRFHYDTAQIANPVALFALRQVVTVARMVFGTDYWFRGTKETAEACDASQVLTEQELEAVGRGNALALIPALRAHLDGQAN